MPETLHEPGIARISVVIPLEHRVAFFDDAAELPELSAITNQRIPIIDDILVVADGRPLSLTLMPGATRNGPPVRLIGEAGGNGPVRKLNSGLAGVAPGNDVLIVSRETMLVPTVLESLFATAAHLRDQGVRWATLSPAANSGSYAVVPSVSPRAEASPVTFSAVLSTLCRTLFSPRTDIVEVPVASSGCVLLSAEALQERDRLDETLRGVDGALADWCLQVSQCGYQHYFVPATYVHRENNGRPCQPVEGVTEEDAAILEARYPWYLRTVEQAAQSGDVGIYREILEPYWRLLTALAHHRVSLHLAPAESPRLVLHLQHMVAELGAAGRSVIVLTPANIGGLCFISVEADGEPFGALSGEAVAQLIEALARAGGIAGESLTLHGMRGWPLGTLVPLAEALRREAALRTIAVHDDCFLGELQGGEGSLPELHPSSEPPMTLRRLLSRFDRIHFLGEGLADVYRGVLPVSGLPAVERRFVRAAGRKGLCRSAADSSPRLPLRLFISASRSALVALPQVRELLDELSSVHGHNSRRAPRFEVFEWPGALTPRSGWPGARGGRRILSRDTGPGFLVILEEVPSGSPYDLIEASAHGLAVLTLERNAALATLIRSLDGGRIFPTIVALREFLRSPAAELRADAEKLARNCQFEYDPLEVQELYRVSLKPPITGSWTAAKLTNQELTNQRVSA